MARPGVEQESKLKWLSVLVQQHIETFVLELQIFDF